MDDAARLTYDVLSLPRGQTDVDEATGKVGTDDDDGGIPHFQRGSKTGDEGQ